MSLARATLPDGAPVALPGGPPFRATDLEALRGVYFDLPADDPWVEGTGDAAHAYLDNARAAWVDEPGYMNVLHPSSPCFELKAVEAGLYLHHWAPWLQAPRRVLDIGCGVGRFTTRLLDQGATVWGVDADLDSLRRCAWHAAGRAGHLDLSWSSVHALPDVEVDVVLAAEVWCYVPDVVGAIARAVERLAPGGVLLASVEARWGWAVAADAPEGGIAHALVGDGLVDLPGDRWVKTYEGHEIRALLADAGLDVQALIPSHYVLDGPLEQVMPGVPDLDTCLDLEAAAAAHPVWAPLHRIWQVAAVKPR